MKSLVALSALVALTIAAPAQPGAGLGDTLRTPNWYIQAGYPDFMRRDKKSPSGIAVGAQANTELQNLQHFESGASTHMPRSYTYKKPLIVKKKNGYRLYRDSEEEKANADSQESCGRQVKVKLCDEDGKFKAPMPGSAHEMTDFHTPEDDVKQSIRMAKEAVENLQRDLKKMEQNKDMKPAQDTESDTELHEDIEVARQALEHIHENFGNLESMSLHPTASRDSEPMHDVTAKTEEERMAQWKEAIENIQKNFEIVKNIEDSFRTASNPESLAHLDQSESIATDEHTLEEKVEPLPEVNHMRADENTGIETHNIEKGDQDKLLNKDEQLSGHNAREEPGDDMNVAASEMIETHLENINKPLMSESHKIHEHEKSAEGPMEPLTAHTEEKPLDNKVDDHHLGKASEQNVDLLTDLPEHHIPQTPSMKAAEEGTQTKLDLDKDAAFKTSENDGPKDIHTDAHIIPMKPSDLDALNEQQKSVENEDKVAPQHIQQKSGTDDMTSDDMIDFMAKSAGHPNTEETEKAHLHQENVMNMGKNAESLKPENVEPVTENWDMQAKEAVHNPVIETKDDENIHMPKSVDHLEPTNIPEQDGNVMLAKSADHGSLLEHQMQPMIEHKELPLDDTMPAMKAAEEHLHHLDHFNNRHLDHLASMKAGEDFEMGHGHGVDPEHTMDHLRNSYGEHSQVPTKMGMPHDFELPRHGHPHSHFPQRYHPNQKPHSKHHDMNGMGSAAHSNYHPGMRDAAEGLGSDHMFSWKPTHESARGAYGSGISSGSIGSTGAVGVFPNANANGCGIPLLLSCSPSVVSGSLAKPHPAVAASYSAPSSYRSEDDFGFHNKRDIKKTSERTANALRTTIMKQKSPILIEKKM